jgi:hypothetical protein
MTERDRLARDPYDWQRAKALDVEAERLTHGILECVERKGGGISTDAARNVADFIQAAIERAVAAERERCAMIANGRKGPGRHHGNVIAAWIRRSPAPVPKEGGA